MYKHFALLCLSLGLTLGFAPEIQAQDCSRPGTCRGGGNVNPRPPANPGRVNPAPTPSRPPANPGRVDPTPSRPPANPGRVNPAPTPSRPPANPGRVDPAPTPSRPPANPGRVDPTPSRPPANPGRVTPAPTPSRPPANPGRVDPTPSRPPANPGRVTPAPTPSRPPANPGRVNPSPRPPVNPGYGYNTPVRPSRPAPARPPTDYRRDTRWDYNRATTYHNQFRHFDNWHRPNYRYTRVYHTPYYSVPRHTIVYYTPRDYYYHLSYRDIYWNQWIRVRINYNDGYYWYNNYPYFVYNGYRHRYSPVEYCDYELVDGWNNTTHTSFHGQTCQAAYDRCANLRDDLNYYAGDYRYFCSERFFDDPFSYDHWDFYDDFYNDYYAY